MANCSILMEIYSQSSSESRTLKQSTMHLSQSDEDVNKWKQLLRKYSAIVTNSDTNDDYTSRIVEITIEHVTSIKYICHFVVFTNQNPSDIEMWREFMASINPLADERKL